MSAGIMEIFRSNEPLVFDESDQVSGEYAALKAIQCYKGKKPQRYRLIFTIRPPADRYANYPGFLLSSAFPFQPVNSI